jgi:Bacterial conjugation TrbI-like protein
MEDRPERIEQEARVEPEEGSERDIGKPEEELKRGGIGETFRTAYRRVKEGQPRTIAQRPTGNPLVSERAAQNRDRTKAMFVMVAGVVVLLVVFLGLFSSSHGDSKRAQAARRGNPSLGRPGNMAEGGRPGSVTPLLSAELNGQEAPNDQLTPEDINSTAHPKAPGESSSAALESKRRPNPRALNNVPFSDPALEAYRQQLQSPAPDSPHAMGSYNMPAAAPALQTAVVTSEPEALAKSSLVYVRTAGMSSAGSVGGAAGASVPATEPAFLDKQEWSGLPPGTRLVARLQTAVSTAVKAPVVAVIETHYERDGEIVVPAGTKAFGELQNASRSGFVGIRFHTVQMPDGTTHEIDAGAMSLTFGPLKGHVTGTNRGKQFLARTLTGVGTVAAFAVGRPGGFSLAGPMDNTILLRERMAQNIGMAGEQELMNLAYNQDTVVTVPGNTRFFLVLQQGVGGKGSKVRWPAGSRPTARALASNAEHPELPSAAELRELVALKQELNRMYGEAAASRTTAPGTTAPR